MKLQTTIPLKPQQHNQIDYNSNVLLLGSCFVENIGKKLDYFKFQNFQNPFGILFQPLAIERLITNAINDKEYTESDIFFHNEQWHCYDAHSKLSSYSKEELQASLNKQIKLTHNQVNKSTHIIVTLGTAWVYRHIETDAIVANCHKVPQKKFLKELLSIVKITESLQSIITLIRSVNKKASILFTLSPVRHLKDGFIENTQSKAHLIAAIHQVVKPRNNVHYFPSYEIMMDELRDYRFYAEDMIHPNNMAVNYIWDRFQGVWISKDASITMEEVEFVQKGLQHKPFNPKSQEHLKFLKNLEEKKAQLYIKGIVI
ncbi:GSCFA domain-containing protein [Pontimicrobium aquaticum]|uniref:GSCFA domain-containing protein n=1 Tax=Pontimicrobium aquaticum TaxID=2565367 RepID=A0A4V5LQY1_9FLAO|nr:GSCFA domain-containing protein [Pontimicrobium aquaticum]TJY37119.1 GSCFA domain-containing protein [Pontimicrobium aquaticum]